MTDRYAPLGPDVDGAAITLVAQAEYHLLELDRLAAALAAAGFAARLVVPVVRWKPLHSFRPTVRRLRQTVTASNRSLGTPLAATDLLARSQAVVVMNDWGVPRHLVELARAEQCRTYAMVEGVQDYDDVDTGLDRSAYRRVDHVFTMGAAGSETLGIDRCTAIGNERLVEAFRTPVGPAGDAVVINSNFTYGVLPEARQTWVDGAVTAADAAGRRWCLSRHTAERGRSRHRADPRPIDELLDTAGHLVTRFSTVALDALAAGVEVVYHNPHGEREPTFQTPAGFAVTTSPTELEAVLRESPRPRDVVRADAAGFLGRQVLLDTGQRPAERAAAVIATQLG